MKTIDRQRLEEILLYGVFGLGTTAVNIAVYQLLLHVLDYRVSNLIALIAAKVFAYTTNKLFVFRSRSGSPKQLLLEFIRFVLARGATGLMDYFGLIVAVEVFHLDRIRSKYVLQIMVIILNFILSKRIVFRPCITPDENDNRFE